MTTWQLVIGNRRYSSWSLRASLVMAWSGLEGEEILVPFGEPGFREAVARFGGAGLVPILLRDDEPVWDSLAIAETIAEAATGAGLWPDDPAARARARSISAEMHSGFAALRAEMPMEIGGSYPGLGFSDAARRDRDRILGIWEDCLARSGGEGRFLFGARSIADAFYAPVVSRFETYGVELAAPLRAYADAVLALPEMVSWRAAAEVEPWHFDLPRGDVGRV